MKRVLSGLFVVVIAVSIAVVFWSCTELDGLTDPDYAKGGIKGAPAFVFDSVTILPADTTVAPGDTVQFHALMWVEGAPYIHCPEYGLLIPYSGDRDACASYVPKGRYKT
jgi:hypothetical protein